MTPEQATASLHGLLRFMLSKKASDLFLSVDFPPAIKLDGKMTPAGQQRLTPIHTKAFAHAIMNDKQRQEFEAEKECNFAISPPDIGRFRVNVFVQQGHVGLVLRTITSKIPTFDDLKLPAVLRDVCLTKRGLVILVGGTGSGKSTSLAAMIDYRNEHSHGHIITIEDPVEYVHRHKNCLITHREVGADTHNWFAALKNTLRQAPDVILIGEIRDRETMEYAIAFAETGHLCMATLHANSANQALDRIVNFFPEERRNQLLMDLSLNARAIVSQRLIPRADGQGRAAAVEVLLNTPLVADLIFKGEVHSLKEVMAKSREQGMQTFDQALFDLYENGAISYEDALRNADSVNELRLAIKLRGKGAPGTAQGSPEFRVMADPEPSATLTEAG
ncbi:PilT/PilU family type 4a pilus ATPase [Acidiferrobacter thiooxydans]|jgi:twitching motility protein PilU|uniref:Type IV pili twitching motility protein PilT n=1 Tax=Acidiferrobacter thiooxydans TaxID=163359 RepID=A0A1C2FZE1_9GAMM|nr:PilT/PilU family type 4a pilus ATPase [Acidiferrobacter thiooxydans]RCN58748.1 type IV pili twitching motility protein PilT [Acidiferrobacter thiooxydans]UEO00395.1 PilT/PilU family type 4a pilus ATPase [Acidiferrobacter thiooxydans]